jgi:hypothetical protein
MNQMRNNLRLCISILRAIGNGSQKLADRRHLLIHCGVALLLSSGFFATELQGKKGGNRPDDAKVEGPFLWATLEQSGGTVFNVITGDSAGCVPTASGPDLGIIWFGPCLDDSGMLDVDGNPSNNDIVLTRGHFRTYSENGFVVEVQPRLKDEFKNEYSGGIIKVISDSRDGGGGSDTSFTLVIEAAGVPMIPIKGRYVKRDAEPVGYINLGKIVFRDCDCTSSGEPN